MASAAKLLVCPTAVAVCVLGDTVIDATGTAGAPTTIAAVALSVGLLTDVAVTLLVPIRWPTTRPALGVSATIPVTGTDQVTNSPAISVPRTSTGFATNVVESPRRTDAVVGVIVTPTRRCFTVTDTVSAKAPTAATMRAVPGSFVVTMPPASTDATFSSRELQSTRVSLAAPTSTAVERTLSPSICAAIGFTRCIAVTSKFDSGPGYKSMSSCRMSPGANVVCATRPEYLTTSTPVTLSRVASSIVVLPFSFRPPSATTKLKSNALTFGSRNWSSVPMTVVVPSSYTRRRRKLTGADFAAPRYTTRAPTAKRALVAGPNLKFDVRPVGVRDSVHADISAAMPSTK